MERIKNIGFNGFASIADDGIYFRYEENKVTLYFSHDYSPRDEYKIYEFLGIIPETQRNVYFRLSAPLLSNATCSPFGTSISLPVDYFVMNIKLDENLKISAFKQVVFSSLWTHLVNIYQENQAAKCAKSAMVAPKN